VGVLEALDASAVRRWCGGAVDALTVHRREIDDLNVYPVPDGDTGTNMQLTMIAARDALRADGAVADLASATRAMARGAVLGARGNSGVILSQMLRGMAEALALPGSAGGPAMRAALRRSAELAYAAVGEPVEGTILSVARAAADAADRAESDDLAVIVRAAAAGAAEALARTPRQLAALARAGVVDAGGRGLVVVLEALAAVVAGDSESRPPPRFARDRRLLQAARETGSDEYDYEVQYLLSADEDAVAALRQELATLGDSLAVVGTGDGLWNVHVHVNDVGAAVEAGVEAGRPHRITVTRFADAEAAGAAVGGAGARAGPPRSGVAVVAVAPGEGIADLFGTEGVTVISGGPGRNPSTDEVLAAIEGTDAASVVVLPNHGNVTGVADAAAEQAREQGIEVAVVHTRSPVQGLAAVAVHDPTRRFADDVIAMAEAAAATRWAEVTVAVRAALTMAGPCQAGDVLGLAEGDVVLIGRSVADVASELLDRMLFVGGELVTLVVGADADTDLADRLRRHVAVVHPEVEVTAYPGGQPHYPLLIGIE
jgi:uncharacterized protein